MVRHIALAAAAVLVLPAGCHQGGVPPDADPPGAAAGLERGEDDGAEVDFWLTLLHHNDGESGLLPREVEGFGEVGGIARFATLVERLRTGAVRRPACGPETGSRERAACGVLLLSSGDNFLPGPVFDVSLERGVPFHDGVALDLIGYDAIIIGNHDFDFGPDVLARFVRSFPTTRPPFLSANLDVGAEPALDSLRSAGRLAGSVVVETRGRPVGIVGATTELLPIISTPRRVDVRAARPAVQREVDELTARGVDRIVLVSHLQSTDEDRELVAGLRGVDVVIAGGGDELLANAGTQLLPGDEPADSYPMMVTDAEGRTVPVVTTVGDYRYVGQLVVGFDGGEVAAIPREHAGPRRVAAADGLRPDPEIQSRVVEPVRDAVSDLREEILATQEPPLDATRKAVRTRESNVGDLVADAVLWQAGRLASSFDLPRPDVAIQHGGGIRTNRVLPAGHLTALEAFELLPFANFVTVVPRVSRNTFLEILEHAVADVEGGAARFAQVSGFRFTWDPEAEAGSRIVSATLDDGTEIVERGEAVTGPGLTVATLDFVARGGDGYPFGDASFTSLGVTQRQALESYVTEALGGEIRSTEYPVGGTGRITTR